MNKMSHFFIASIPKKSRRRDPIIGQVERNMKLCFGESEDLTEIDKVVVVVLNNVLLASGVVDGHRYDFYPKKPKKPKNVIWLHSLCVPNTAVVNEAKIVLKRERLPSPFRALWKGLMDAAQDIRRRKRGFKSAKVGMLVDVMNPKKDFLISLYTHFGMVLLPGIFENFDGMRYHILIEP